MKTMILGIWALTLTGSAFAHECPEMNGRYELIRQAPADFTNVTGMTIKTILDPATDVVSYNLTQQFDGSFNVEHYIADGAVRIHKNMWNNETGYDIKASCSKQVMSLEMKSLVAGNQHEITETWTMESSDTVRVDVTDSKTGPYSLWFKWLY